MFVTQAYKGLKKKNHGRVSFHRGNGVHWLFLQLHLGQKPGYWADLGNKEVSVWQRLWEHWGKTARILLCDWSSLLVNQGHTLQEWLRLPAPRSLVWSVVVTDFIFVVVHVRCAHVSPGTLVSLCSLPTCTDHMCEVVFLSMCISLDNCTVCAPLLPDECWNWFLLPLLQINSGQ